MKRFLFVLLIILGFQTFSTAKKVSIEEAALAGKNFYFEHVNAVTSMPYSKIIITTQHPRIMGSETVFFIFNINEDDGFVIVSADDAAEPVLGYSFTGHYRDESQPPQFLEWSNGYAKEIEWITEQGLQQDFDLAVKWNHLLTLDSLDLFPENPSTIVNPLLTSTWNQCFPYNSMCPVDPGAMGGYNGHVPVGCVATAMAQVLFYWRYPNNGAGYHCIYPLQAQYGPQCADFTNTTYIWTGMNDDPHQECDPVALLSWQCGISVNMQYGPTSSGAYISDCENALRNNFLYSQSANYVEKSDYTTTDWENLLKADLNLRRPIIYAGSNTTSGHAWVCDGYQGTNYFHFNWGWGGACNGYYYLNNLNPGGNNYNSHQEAVWNIYPDPTLYPVGCSGQTVLNDYSFGSIEDGSGPSANYTDNQSCSWLIAPDDSIQSISLNFRRMMTEETADIITVYDGSTTGSPVLGTFSGNTLPPSFNLVTTGPCMLVTFSSNASVTGNGFLAQYSSTPVDFCPQNATLTDYDGVISDGSGRFRYRNSSNCNWIIQPPNATSVTLVFDTLNTEMMKDFVEVYDYPGMEDLGRFSGFLQPPVITSGPAMLVVFKSDLLNRGEGFSATYTTITGSSEITDISDLKIFPVPAEDLINIEFSMKQQGRACVEIFGVTGNAVYRNEMGTCIGRVSVMADLGSVPSGIYLLKITTGEGTLNRKIVVN